MTDVFQLRSDLPLVWRSPDSFQIGIDPPHAIVDDLPDAALPLLADVVRGVSSGGLQVSENGLALPPGWLDRFLDNLRPALRPTTQSPPSRVSIVGQSPATAVVQSVWEHLGSEVTVLSGLEGTWARSTESVVVVADYVVDPRWISALQYTDTRHTPVIFTDQAVWIGPSVIPGLTPCLVCREMSRRDQWPDWLTVSSQLWSLPSEPARSPLALLAAAHAVTVHQSAPPVGGPWSALRVNAADWSLSRERVTFHPDCTCRGLTTHPETSASRNRLGRR